MSFPSDLEIARSVTPRRIVDVATDLGLREDEIELYGPVKAKVRLGAIERLEAGEPARQVHPRQRDHARRRSARASRRRPSGWPRGSTGSASGPP